MSYRKLLVGICLSGALILWAYTFRIAPRWLRVVRLQVGLPQLAAEWQGMRIAHLSDLHAGGPGVRPDLLRQAKGLALEFEPDVIALTGDFYDEGKPVATDGLWTDWPAGTPVLAVLGNHDYRGGDEVLTRLAGGLEAGGVKLLRNTAAAVTLRGKPAWIVGVDDPFTYQADEAAAFGALPEGEEALLYLAHSPAIATSLPVGRARIVLCGHTHGGQIRLMASGQVPFVNLLRRIVGTGPRRESPIYRGYHWQRGAIVLISDGLGMSKWPVRFRTRPQVLLIELRAAPRDGAGCDLATRYVELLNPEPRLWNWLT